MGNKSHIFLLIFQYYFKLGVILVKRIKVLGIALILLLILVTQYFNVDKSCVVLTENKKDSISKTLNFDELVSEFAKDNKIALDKAKIEIIESLAYSSQKNRDKMSIIRTKIFSDEDYKNSISKSYSLGKGKYVFEEGRFKLR